MISEYWSSEREIFFHLIRCSIPEGGYGERLQAILAHWAAPPESGTILHALPLAVSLACGGRMPQAVPVCAAWRLLRLAAKLLDDIEDGDIQQEVAQTVNAATGLIFLSQRALHALCYRGASPSRVTRLVDEMNRASLVTCAGQNDDLAGNDPDPDRWLAIAEKKSGALFGWAAWAGAYTAGVGDEACSEYREYGTALGILLQVADDHSGVWCPDGASDLTTGRPTLAVAYAHSVADEAERCELGQHLEFARGGDAEAEMRARDLLNDLGAQAFIMAVARVQKNRAIEALDRAGADSVMASELYALPGQILVQPQLSGD